MNIQKRNAAVFILLNCLTLGIYGAIQSNKMGNEINALCKNDGEEPGVNYFGALFIRAIPAFFGVIVGLIIGIVSSSLVLNNLPFFGYGSPFSSYYNQLNSVKVGAIFLSILICVVIFSLIGRLASGIYHKYWWFKQTGRLQLNACRYNMEVREKGSDHFVFRTAIELPLFPATIALKAVALFLPTLMCFLIALASPVFAVILYTMFIIIACVFGAEITAGACFSIARTIKVLNRYATVYRNGAKPFDPMAYQYYPCVDSRYPETLPAVLDNKFIAPEPVVQQVEVNDGPGTDWGITTAMTGKLVGVKGSCAGYEFDINPGEEIVVGKDAKVANVVIDPAYKEISRKHVSIIYDERIDMYRVTDYSSNGTWADGQRLVRNETTNLRRGTTLKLANDKNIFTLL